jgi:putative membrane protein
MKTILNIFSIACLALLMSCGDTKENTDSKEVAKEQNDDKFDSTKIEDDTKFAVDAAAGGMMEVKMGTLAQANGMAADVKSFGKMMVDDHNAANEELKALAAKKNISLPTTLSEKHQKDYDDMAAKKGKDFDEAYMDYMISDHKDDIDEFKEEANDGHDPDMKAWAAGKVATLEHHLDMAKAAKDKLKK